jgi:hypothetical protein
MTALEERLDRIEQLLAEVFRPGGTFAICDEIEEPAALMIGDRQGDIGSLLMSLGLSIKEPGEESRVIVTASGVGVKDEHDVLRVLLTQQGLIFLDAAGKPSTLIAADGIHAVADS